jgi:hypothetical protein
VIAAPRKKKKYKLTSHTPGVARVFCISILASLSLDVDDVVIPL